MRAMCLHAIMTNGRPRWAGFCRREEPVTIANTSLPLDTQLKPGNTQTWEFQTCEGSLPGPQIQNNNNVLPRTCQTCWWGVKKGKAVQSKYFNKMKSFLSDIFHMNAFYLSKIISKMEFRRKRIQNLRRENLCDSHNVIKPRGQG